MKDKAIGHNLTSIYARELSGGWMDGTKLQQNILIKENK
jgi:hypothetical protein